MKVSDKRRVAPKPERHAGGWYGDLLASGRSWGAFQRLALGIESVPAGRISPWRSVPEMVLVLTLEGEAVTRAGKRSWAHSPGTLLAMAGGTRFQEEVGPRQPWKSIYWMLSGPAVEAFPTGNLPWARPARGSAAAAAMERGLELGMRPGAGNAWRLQSLALEVLAWAAEQAGGGEDLLGAVRARVDADPGRVWSVAELAAASGLALPLFSRRFRALAGVSPGVWVRRRRVDLASDWLVQGRSVKETAERFGFADAFHFSRTFKSHRGLPPSAYAQCVHGARLRAPIASAGGPPPQLRSSSDLRAKKK